jgi:hypothetical protein
LILTVDDLTDFNISGIEVTALQLLLDATEEMVVRYAGDPLVQVDTIGGGHRFLSLSRRASSITSIEELVGSTTTTLDPATYRLRPDGYLVERLTSSGSLWYWGWYCRATVTFVPVDDTASREMVQRDLVRLALTSNPGVTMEQVGAWLQQFGQGGLAKVERESILKQLEGPPQMVIV